MPSHPLVSHLMAILRARETPTAAFRSAMAELGRILIYEASRDWLPTFETQVDTPLAVADAVVVDIRRPVKVTVYVVVVDVPVHTGRGPIISTALRRQCHALTGWVQRTLGIVPCLSLLSTAQVVPILRAGLIPLEQASSVLPAMETYHVGLIRDEKTLQVSGA